MWDSTDFAGGVFSDRIDGGRAAAQLELRHDGIAAVASDGASFFLSFDECHLEMGGASGHMLFCRNSDRSLTIFCEDRRLPEALEHASGGLLIHQLQRIRHASRRQRHVGRIVVLLACVLLIGLAVAGYFALMLGARSVVRSLPMSIDEKIGEAAFHSMDLGGVPVDDAIVQDGIQKLVDRLQKTAGFPHVKFRVHVVRSSTVNAFALPGGQIVVYTGLIRKSAKPEHLAGVLAHEMAHVALRHGLQRIAQSVGVVAAVNLLLGDTSGLIAVGAEVLKSTTINAYSRDHEAEADDEAVRILDAAAVDPMALAEFFQRMRDDENDIPDMVSWFGTHPDDESRIQSIKRSVSVLSHRKYTPIDLDWDTILQRLPRSDQKRDTAIVTKSLLGTPTP